MMDIQGMTGASGLSAEDRATLSDLVEVYGEVSLRNAMLDGYYEDEQETPSIWFRVRWRSARPGWNIIRRPWESES